MKPLGMVTIETPEGTRQVFLLGKFPYYAPPTLGAGYRTWIELAKVNNALDTGALAGAMSVLNRQIMPKGMDPKRWEEQLQAQATETISSMIDFGKIDNDLAILETLLTPAPGSPTVKKAYLEFSTKKQIKAVVDFSKTSAEDKTETVSAPPSIGKGSKRGTKGGT